MLTNEAGEVTRYSLTSYKFEPKLFFSGILLKCSAC